MHYKEVLISEDRTTATWRLSAGRTGCWALTIAPHGDLMSGMRGGMRGGMWASRRGRGEWNGEDGGRDEAEGGAARKRHEQIWAALPAIC